MCASFYSSAPGGAHFHLDAGLFRKEYMNFGLVIFLSHHMLIDGTKIRVQHL